MRALIVTPPQSQATGNHVTAERHRKGLQSFGWAVRIVEAPDTPLLDEETALFPPDVLLLLHAFRSGRPWLHAPRSCALPAAVLLTGTDIHGGINSFEQGGEIRKVLSHASAIITQNPITYEELRRRDASWTKKLHFLPPGIILGSEPYPLRSLNGIQQNDVLFLHPAGVRPVKGNMELLSLLEPIAHARPDFRVAFCGPVLDEEYGRVFLEEVGKRPWALYLGVIPPDAMASALKEADIVLNNSLSEGMPNALLEASATGRPILARANSGNCAVVEEGVNGLLYRTREEFVQLAALLVKGNEIRRRLSFPCPERYAPEEEARALDTILKKHTFAQVN